VHKVGNQPRIYYDARSTNHQVTATVCRTVPGHSVWSPWNQTLFSTLVGKVKVHPRTGHEGYSYTLSLTSALDGSGWSTSRPGRLLVQLLTVTDGRVAGYIQHFIAACALIMPSSKIYKAAIACRLQLFCRLGVVTYKLASRISERLQDGTGRT
jgi:hypothetical protein